jgi:hypothetical protein
MKTWTGIIGLVTGAICFIVSCIQHVDGYQTFGSMFIGIYLGHVAASFVLAFIIEPIQDRRK